MHSLERQIARLESQCKISLKDHPQRSRYCSSHCTLPLISHKVHYVGPIFCLACVNFWALWDANWLWLRLAFASAKWKLTISFVVYFVHVTWHCVQHTQQAREWWGEISIKTSSPSHACMIRLVFIHCSFKAKIMKQQLHHVFGGMQLLQESLLKVTGDEDRINPLAPKR
jgi:hypothetical protein